MEPSLPTPHCHTPKGPFTEVSFNWYIRPSYKKKKTARHTKHTHTHTFSEETDQMCRTQNYEILEDNIGENLDDFG